MAQRTLLRAKKKRDPIVANERPRQRSTAQNSGLFICWSGPRGLQLAERLKVFLGSVLPELKDRTFSSPQIEKGARWFEEVIRQLERARVGILCLTSESLASPWLHFEAGALVKGLHGSNRIDDGESTQNRIFTYLHGVSATNISGPLAQYQSTLANRADTCMLIESLCRTIFGSVPDAYRTRFDQHWPAFEADLKRIHIPIQELISDFERWFRRKTFEEPLQQCTDQNWIGRYDGARQTHDRLSENLARVRSACPRYQADLYERLLALVESYAMDIRALLLRAEPFSLNPKGELEIPVGILQACEKRRRHIKEIVSRMLDPLAIPTTDEAAAFWISDSFDQCKLLVHRREHAVLAYKKDKHGASKEMPDDATARSYFSSLWELDRIFGYLLMEYLHFQAPGAMDSLCKAAVIELERYRAKESNRSLMPCTMRSAP